MDGIHPKMCVCVCFFFPRTHFSMARSDLESTRTASHLFQFRGCFGNKKVHNIARRWFHFFLILTPIPAKMIKFDLRIFFTWVVVQPPTNDWSWSSSSLIFSRHVKKKQRRVYSRETTMTTWRRPLTPPKFNSSPMKSYRNPIGKDRLPFPPFFRGKLAVRLRGV